MSSERESLSKVPLPLPNVRPTDDKLEADAADLCRQYLQFWNPGEVEITVILSRPGSRRQSLGTSVTERERLVYALKTAIEQSSILGLKVRGQRPQR